MQTGPGDRPVRPSKPKRKPKPTVVKAPAGDIASSGGDYGTKQAKRAERSAPVKRAQRAVYDAQPTARKKQILANAKGSVKANLEPIHKARVERNRELAKGAAGKDTKGNADVNRAARFLAAHPEILKPPKEPEHSHGLAGFIDNALTGKLTAGAVHAAEGAATTLAPYMVAALRGPGKLGDEAIKKTTGVDITHALNQFAKAAGRDLVDIPANAVPSLYVPGKAAATGHPVEAAKMLVEPYVETAKHPLKSLEEHPIGTALLASGAEAALGRGLGKGLRTAPVKRLKQAGSIERGQAEIANANTSIREDRTYSKDAFIKAGQVLHDKRRAAKGKEPVGGHVTVEDVARRSNERAAANEDIRRSNRAQVVHDARTALDQRGPVAKLKGRRPTAATTAAAQHIADTPAELRTLLEHYREAAKGLQGDKLRRNRQTQGLLEKALKHPGRLAHNTEQAARYRELNLRIQKDLEETGIIDPKQMESRRLLSYATTPAKGEQGMGARMLTPEETRAQVGSAVERHTKAKKALKRAERDLAKAQAAEGEASGRAQILSRNVDGTNGAEAAAASGESFAGGGHGVEQAASRRVAAEAIVQKRASDLKAAEKGLAKARKTHQQGGHLVDEAGNKVTRTQILEHMAANGIEDAGAYVTHAPGKRGARNFYVSTDKAPGYHGPKATGAAVKEGTLDLHPETMVESVAHAQGLVDAAHRFRAFVDEFAHRKPSGKVQTFKSFQDAVDHAREMMVDKNGDPVPHALEMRPVRINPLGGRGEQLRATLEATDHASAATHINEALDHALSGAEGGPGEWALVPAKAAEVQREHLGVGSTALGKLGQMYGGQFRKVVLSLSPKWLTGNVAEASLRALVGHAGVRSWYTGHEAQKRYERLYGAEAAAELRSRTTGGGHYSLSQRVDVRRGAEDAAQAGARVARFAEAMGKLRQVHGPKEIAGAWDAWTHFVMQSLNGRIEHQFQTAMFGKALREHPLMSDRTNKLTREALDDAAAGLRDTNAQVRLGREVDRMYGKYSKFSPGTRRLIAGYTPFIAWSLNTVRFLFDVLPRDHPVLTSVIASANQATEEWRKHHGLISSFVENLAGANPAFLQGSIPGKEGSNLRVSHYTPFGIYDQEGGLLGAFSNALLPQVQGIQQNLVGLDWKGDSLTGKDRNKHPTDARNLLAAAMTTIENSIPLVSQGATLAGAHLPNEPDGTKRPDSVGARARKAWDPFMYSKSTKAGGSNVSTQDILSGKAKMPPLPELPPLPRIP